MPSYKFGMLVNMLLPKRIIIKSRIHLEWVARNSHCIKCRTTYGLQSAHIRKTDNLGNVGWGQKNSDVYVVPLCYLCHELALKSPDKKVKQFAKEGKLNDAIKYWDDLKTSAEGTTKS